MDKDSKFSRFSTAIIYSMWLIKGKQLKLFN